MGLFDRIKKAFSGKTEEDKEQETKKVEQSKTEENSEPSTEDNQETSSQTDQEVKETKPSEEESDSSANEEPTSTSNDSTDEQPEQASEETSDETTDQAAPASTDVESTDEESNTESVETEDESSPATKAEDHISSQEDETAQLEETDKESEGVSEETADEESNSESEETADDESEEKEVEEYDEGLKKSRNSFSARFNRFLANFRSVDEEFFDDLEELLIESDVGYETALRISDELREEVKLRNAKKRSDVSDVIVEKLVDMYDEEGKEEDNALHFSSDKTPTVFLFVGVNGAGKTTTIGKLAHRFQSQGKKVLLAAGDTFRAGAIEQLQGWGKRVNVPVEAKPAQTDPASVVYDAVQRAIKEDYDILLVDTAGRLQNNQNLMRELEKIKRVITRELPEAPQEVLLVLDGSTGQNALSQAKQFNETTNVTGIVLTKLDGSSQGGIVLAIRNELHLPVKLVGLGEQMNDLRDFDAEKFIYGLFKDLIVGSGE